MNIQEKIEILREVIKRASEVSPAKLKAKFKGLDEFEMDVKYKDSNKTPRQLIKDCEIFQSNLNEAVSWLERILSKAIDFKITLK